MGAARLMRRHGEELTTWAVLTGGTRVRMYFVGSDGAAHRLVLPFDVLSPLMTSPRILQTALDARISRWFSALVHQLGTWRIEQSEGGAASSLGSEHRTASTLPSHLTHRNAGSLGAALIAAPISNIDERPN